MSYEVVKQWCEDNRIELRGDYVPALQIARFLGINPTDITAGRKSKTSKIQRRKTMGVWHVHLLDLGKVLAGIGDGEEGSNHERLVKLYKGTQGTQ